ncbi:hypothetical protein LCM10_04320 [Rossellomorea aquimaris]|uniref:hypothetical protein n=1 Tax=Rossellomorea aquimaris TaxID=189382 RepID=UPI001CD6FBC6|nr:hypothetical protein [Rossellomorea aquimaris]MCA1054202.1 hypothetical protein [Rossellomorea aquimaris]
MKGKNTPAEHYEKAGILVYYHEDGVTSHAFEFVDQANPTLEGINFLKMKRKKAKTLLGKLDENLFEDEDTIISVKYGISLYFPEKKQNQY